MALCFAALGLAAVAIFGSLNQSRQFFNDVVFLVWKLFFLLLLLLIFFRRGTRWFSFLGPCGAVLASDITFGSRCCFFGVRFCAVPTTISDMRCAAASIDTDVVGLAIFPLVEVVDVSEGSWLGDGVELFGISHHGIHVHSHHFRLCRREGLHRRLFRVERTIRSRLVRMIICVLPSARDHENATVADSRKGSRRISHHC